MSKIDLQIHSSCSADGEFTVSELLRLCKEAQIKYLSITDHNTVRAVSEIMALASKFGMEAISGVELDCVHMGRNFHLLGYHFDHTLPVFAELEHDILKQEENAAEQKIELIQKAIGIPLSTEEVLCAAKGKIVTGELIAEIILQKEAAKENESLLPYRLGGTRSDNPFVNFYWDFFSQGKAAYVPINYITLSEGVELLHDAGGIAVLAHPAQNLQGDYDLLEQIIKTGIDGMEAYSSYHSKSEAAFFDCVARDNGLLTTCGSDFHGKIKPSIALCGHRAGNNMPKIIAALRKKGIVN